MPNVFPLCSPISCPVTESDRAAPGPEQGRKGRRQDPGGKWKRSGKVGNFPTNEGPQV